MDQDDSAERPQSERERRPYSPPRIEESARFENMLLSCSMDVSDPDCMAMVPSLG